MRVIIVESEEAIGPIVADAIGALVAVQPGPVLGLATGSSPLPIYEELGRRYAAGTLSLRHAHAFLLDEYLGLPPDHPERYRNVIATHFAARVDIDMRNISSPDGTADDPHRAAATYDAAITASGGVDFQIVGVGANGHIAFNEPGSSLASRTRVLTLTRRTRTDNARFFGGDIDAVPRQCITQGLGTIMEARRILLTATGEHKAEAVQRTIEGPVTAMCPGSVLQMHPAVTAVIDTAAASRLELADYYRETTEPTVLL